MAEGGSQISQAGEPVNQVRPYPFLLKPGLYYRACKENIFDPRFVERILPLLPRSDEIYLQSPNLQSPNFTPVYDRDFFRSCYEKLRGKISPQLLAHWIFVVGIIMKTARESYVPESLDYIKGLLGLLARIFRSEAFGLLLTPHSGESRMYLRGFAMWSTHPAAYPDGRDLKDFIIWYVRQFAKQRMPDKHVTRWRYEVDAVVQDDARVAEELAGIMREARRWLPPRTIDVPDWLQQIPEAAARPKASKNRRAVAQFDEDVANACQVAKAWEPWHPVEPHPGAQNVAIPDAIVQAEGQTAAVPDAVVDSQTKEQNVAAPENGGAGPSVVRPSEELSDNILCKEQGDWESAENGPQTDIVESEKTDKVNSGKSDTADSGQAKGASEGRIVEAKIPGQEQEAEDSHCKNDEKGKGKAASQLEEAKDPFGAGKRDSFATGEVADTLVNLRGDSASTQWKKRARSPSFEVHDTIERERRDARAHARTRRVRSFGSDSAVQGEAGQESGEAAPSDVAYSKRGRPLKRWQQYAEDELDETELDDMPLNARPSPAKNKKSAKAVAVVDKGLGNGKKKEARRPSAAFKELLEEDRNGEVAEKVRAPVVEPQAPAEKQASAKRDSASDQTQSLLDCKAQVVDVRRKLEEAASEREKALRCEEIAKAEKAAAAARLDELLKTLQRAKESFSEQGFELAGEVPKTYEKMFKAEQNLETAKTTIDEKNDELKVLTEEHTRAKQCAEALIASAPSAETALKDTETELWKKVEEARENAARTAAKIEKLRARLKNQEAETETLEGRLDSARAECVCFYATKSEIVALLK